MDRIIKKLFCFILGHNFHIEEDNIVCVRCGKKEEINPQANSFFLGDIQINQWDDIEDATTDN